MVVEIDGSVLEGGGQILRSAIAFAAVLGQQLIVDKIRAKRTTPGLRPQHLHGILAIKELTKAQVKGTHEGSKRIEFFPQKKQGGSLIVNIGTAGAISLVLQGLMIVAPFCKHPITAKLTGGTNVAWSPPIDYLKNVLLPRLEQMGFLGEIEISKRGYYPRGGGHVKTELSPIKKLQSLSLTNEKLLPIITGISHCGSLPRHIAERQAGAAKNLLTETGHSVDIISIEHIQNTHSPGSGISLFAKNSPNRIIGADALGRRGLKAEKVGESAARSLLDELATHASVDQFQADMLIPYIALANGTSTITISKLTLHTITNIHIVEQFLDIKFEIQGKLGTRSKIKVKGIGFEGEVISQ
ncbi:MAG: RNA 3'-terminal phosphate cyclase [Promethearchaeota archaeon]